MTEPPPNDPRSTDGRVTNLSNHAWVEYAHHVPPDEPPTWRIEDFINPVLLLLPEGLCQHQRNSLGLRRLQQGFVNNHVTPCHCQEARCLRGEASLPHEQIVRRLPTSAWLEARNSEADGQG